MCLDCQKRNYSTEVYTGCQTRNYNTEIIWKRTSKINNAEQIVEIIAGDGPEEEGEEDE